MTKKIVATIEARMGSSRLPGKVMKEILGKPILQIIFERASKSKLLNEVVIATTTNPRDDVIVEMCKKNNFLYYRGNEEDVLDRVLSAAKSRDADVIVELISDNPLIDPEVIDQVVQFYLDNNYDYVSNFIPKVTFPTGIGAQVFSKDLLEEVDMLTNDLNDSEYTKNRENVTWYIYHHREKYKIGNFEATEIFNNSKIRLDLDNPEDFELIKKIYENFNSLTVSLKDVLEFLMKNPELIQINQKYLIGDEKYK